MRRKQKIVAILVLGILFSLGVQMFAAAAPESSNAAIDFTEYTGVTTPKDPESPDEEGTGTGTGQNGPLSLDYVPDLNFGAHNVSISNQMQTYNTTSVQPYIQVTDLRGSGSGWRVSASLSPFTSSGVSSLQGAYIELLNGSAISSYQTLAPVPNTTVVLESDHTPEDVVTAGIAGGGEGRGTWLIRWYPVAGAADVTLNIPAASAAAGTHTATITWTLYDAP